MRTHATALLASCAALLAGCERQPSAPPAPTSQAADSQVVVYTALDREFSEPILQEFTRLTGIAVHAAYDTESTKTVGLANRIRAEAGRPRCDVFWNNEILNTLRLKKEGLLQPCQPPEAANYPAAYRDPEGFWFGFAARARVLLVNTTLVPADRMPTSIRDLADPRWKGRTGIAKPLFGTTASHVACLFAQLGEEQARAWLASLKVNDVQIVAGNKACATMVAAGQLAFGLTDTDDALGEIAADRPVRIVFPDSVGDGLGTLLLPNTLAVVNKCPHPNAAVRLIDYLLSVAVEERLADGPSGQIPLHRGASVHSRVGALTDLHAATINFERAAEAFPVAANYIASQFLAP